eukprot:2517455-Amphidinium_carterae.2
MIIVGTVFELQYLPSLRFSVRVLVSGFPDRSTPPQSFAQPSHPLGDRSGRVLVGTSSSVVQQVVIASMRLGTAAP